MQSKKASRGAALLWCTQGTTQQQWHGLLRRPAAAAPGTSTPCSLAHLYTASGLSCSAATTASMVAGSISGSSPCRGAHSGKKIERPGAGRAQCSRRQTQAPEPAWNRCEAKTMFFAFQQT